MRRFELAEGKSSKFWEVAVEGASLTVRFGRIGTTGQEKTKPFASPAAAQKENDKLIAEKVGKGYTEVGGGANAASVPLGASLGITPEEIMDVRALAESARDEGELVTRVYFIVVGEEPWTKGSVNRAGGPPIGVAKRPEYDGKPMQHLVTIDLAAMPEVKATHNKLAKARAVALFISDAMENEAFDEDTKETRVLILSDADIAKGEISGDDVNDPEPRGFTLWPVDVPSRVFKIDRFDDEVEATGGPICELYDELMSAARVGGDVIAWSGAAAQAGFLFQFAEELIDVNLGDAGTMYVFLDKAYWTGH